MAEWSPGHVVVFFILIARCSSANFEFVATTTTTAASSEIKAEERASTESNKMVLVRLLQTPAEAVEDPGGAPRRRTDRLHQGRIFLEE